MCATIEKDNFIDHCNAISAKDKDLKAVLDKYGYPPLWSRPPGFATLIHIILEQQVSLSSAKAALSKLEEKIGTLKPEKLLALSDAELKSCYFSRQKIVYARQLADAIHSGSLDLGKFNWQQDETIRTELKRIKGIGDWTADIYLIMALGRLDIFPAQDLAIIKSLKKLKGLSPGLSKTELLEHAEPWRPRRSVASMILWHHYLSERARKS